MFETTFCKWFLGAALVLGTVVCGATAGPSTAANEKATEVATTNAAVTENAAEAATQVKMYRWNGWAFISKRVNGKTIEQTVYGSGTTHANNVTEAAAFGMNRFRWGQLQQLEKQGWSIDRCSVTAVVAN
jgi:hypothetical protein